MTDEEMEESTVAAAGAAAEEDVKASSMAAQAGSTSSASRAEHLKDVVKEMWAEILNESESKKYACGGEPSLRNRIRYVLREKGPSLQQATRAFVDEIVVWLREGGPLRAFLFTTVGAVMLLALSGLAAFLIFFLIATTNAVAVALLMSLTAVGAFMAVFFSSLIFIYVGALLVASVTISTGVVLCACAALFIAGWAGFIWVVWTVLNKGLKTLQGSVRLRALT